MKLKGGNMKFLFLVIPIGLLSIAYITLSVIGVIIAFSSSIILGVLILFIQPSACVVGVAWIYGMNIPMIIQQWIEFPI